MSELPELAIYNEGSGGFSVLPKAVAKLTRGQAKEIKHRVDCHDGLVALVKKAHKEGYVDGYGDGVDTDGCGQNSIIDQGEWARCWNESDAKAALAKEAEE